MTTLTNKISCVVEAHNLVGEGPLWHPESECVFWTDINGFKIWRYSPATGETAAWSFSEPVCSLSLTTDPERLLVALGSAVIIWRPETDERRPFARPEPNIPANRMNDGATDPSGYFWVGSMANNVGQNGEDVHAGGFTGSLFRVAPDGSVTVWDDGFGITNTLEWSPDRKTFYCGCSVKNVIYAYDFDEATHSIRNRRVFFEGAERGLPDGSAMDADGWLWNCRFFGKCILGVSPAGVIERVIEMPVSNITNCVFGGKDLKTLYVTTASMNSSGEPLAGSLFAVEMETGGLVGSRFLVS